jgi:Domain of unknown function (DUF4386)
MTKRGAESSPLTYARGVGILSVVALVCGSFPVFVESRLIVPGNAAATAQNIVASEPLFRLGIVSMLLMNAVYLVAVLGWYRLLAPVSANLAALMVVLILVSFPIAMLNELNQFAALRSAQDQNHAQMTLFLDLHKHGLLIAGIFAGLWLFPLGLLVFLSGYLPRILGVLLMVGCFGYLIRFVQGFLFPGHEASIWTNPAVVVTHVAELSMMVWLLIKGVDVERWERRAGEAAPASGGAARD